MDLLLRVDGRYVCWHSYEARWYLGPKRLSEWFCCDYHSTARTGCITLKGRGIDALAHFPTASVVWRRN